jgi:hypothetical protein
MEQRYSFKNEILIFIIATLIMVCMYFAWVASRPEAKSCKSLNAECQINNSDKTCCSDLQCVTFNERSDNGKCQLIPTAIPTNTPKPTKTPKPTPTPIVIHKVWCHTYFLDCCKDAEFLGEKCPRKWVEGKCPTITPTPTAEVTPTVTPTETPEVTLTVTPSPTLEPVKEVVVQVGSSPSNDAPRCEEMTPVKVNDVWYSDYRVENGKASLELHWGLNDAYKNVNIVYGHKPLEWVYGAVNIPNNGSLRIGELEPYTTYWFSVQYVFDKCATGEFSSPIDP